MNEVRIDFPLAGKALRPEHCRTILPFVHPILEGWIGKNLVICPWSPPLVEEVEVIFIGFRDGEQVTDMFDL